MSGLDIFALIILLILFLAGIVVWVLLGILPGRIAHSRNHPQAEAINVCGWWGALTVGILSPLAYVWAYTKPGNADDAKESPIQSVSESAEGT